jgi:hypothetical protein
MTATQAVPVTPHDSTNIANGGAPMFYIGVSGDVTLIPRDGGSAVTYKDVPVGYLFQAASRINATGTDATDILAIYPSNV